MEFLEKKAESNHQSFVFSIRKDRILLSETDDLMNSNLNTQEFMLCTKKSGHRKFRLCKANPDASRNQPPSVFLTCRPQRLAFVFLVPSTASFPHSPGRKKMEEGVVSAGFSLYFIDQNYIRGPHLKP